jgi:CHAD domain-containing protein
MRCALAEKAAKKKLRRGVKTLRKTAVALAREDVEGIHGARVASRRLRAAIQAHKRAIRKPARDAFAETVRDITQGLSAAREYDVTIALLDARRKRLSGSARYAATHTINRLQALREQEHASIAASVQNLDNGKLRDAAANAIENIRKPKQCYLDEARSVISSRQRALWEAHKTWTAEPGDDALHQTRIAFKKLRYSCEQYSDLYGKKMDRFIKQLRTLQEHLGEWNDLRIACRYVQDLSDDAEPMALSGVGPLVELLESEEAARLTAYRELADTFFADAETKRVSRVIDGVKTPCCKD